MGCRVIPVFTGSFTVRLGPEFDHVFHMPVREVPVIIFIIADLAGRTVVVDTSFHPCDIPGTHSTFSRERDKEVGAALAANGIDASEVTDVVLTHCHWDHIGNLELFPKARIWVQALELVQLRDMPGYMEGGWPAPKLVACRERLQLVHGDYNLCPLIRLLYTGGHSLGHQVVEVETEQGRVVLGGDLPFRFEELYASFKLVAENQEHLDLVRSWPDGERVRDEIRTILNYQGLSDPKPLAERSLEEVRAGANIFYHAHSGRLLAR